MSKNNKIKEKINIITRNYDRKPPKHNYLKHWAVVKYWVKRKHKLSEADLQMLLFLYDERLFTYYDFEKFASITVWDKKRFHRLINEGWIHIWKEKNKREGKATIYEITRKSRQMVADVYKKLNGTDDYSENPKRNPVFKREKYTDKVYSTRMSEINRANREQRLRQIHG